MTDLTLQGDDGKSYACTLIDVFEFRDREYGLLLRKEDETLVVIRMHTQSSGSTFRTIQNEEEYQAVVEHIQRLAKLSQEAESYD